MAPRATLPAAVPVTLPAGEERRLRWRVVEEGGTRHSGEVAWAELPLLAEQALDGRRLERRRLTIELDLPEGYHRLILDDPAAAA